jgi:hypothetical protein
MNSTQLIKESSSPRNEMILTFKNSPVKRRVVIPVVLGVAIASPFSYIQNYDYTHATTARYDHIVFADGGPFVNRVKSAMIGKKSVASKIGKTVNAAPLWLVTRMENLQQMPPPTSEEVDTQLRASAEVRKQLTANQNV